MDEAHYRDVMGHYPTGVVCVTGMVGGEPVGMVVGSFGAVSLDPPLVCFLPVRTSRTYARLRRAPALCVNVLAHDQVDECRTLAGPSPDKFDDIRWRPSERGAPLIDGAVAYVHAGLQREVEAGDHLISICAVHDMEVARPVTPLLFFQGGYGGFSLTDMTAHSDTDLITALRRADPARPFVEALARQLQCEVSVLVAANDDELTTAVSAWGGAAEAPQRLGRRIPLVPPLGDAYVAGGGPEVVERWLSKVADPAHIAFYRRRLAKVAADGVAVSMAGPESRADFGRLTETLAEYAAGPLTPARARTVGATLADARRFFEDVTITDGATYDVGVIVAPVRDPDGDVSMVISLGQLPPGASGSTVKSWIAALRQTARDVEVEVGRRWQAASGSKAVAHRLRPR